MANVSMNYETVMIFSTQSGEEGMKALGDKFKALIAENATVAKIEEWGKRRLAYPIEDELEGYYILVEFTSKPDFPAELDRVYKITDGVLRSMIIRKEELDPPKAEAAKPAPAVEAVAEPAVEAVAEPAVEAVAEPAVEAVAEPEAEAAAETPAE